MRPHDIVYCGDRLDDLEKAASENILIDGIAVPKSALAAINPASLEFGLSKSAAASFDLTDPAIHMGDVISGWSGNDKKTLLHLALEASL